jgi:hypothetical protein
VLVVLVACSGDDGAAVPPSTTAPPLVAPTSTTISADCQALAARYLEVFFAVGAGTPDDPAATTVTLPQGRLRGIEAEAREGGCSEFPLVVCSAYAELEDQGLSTRGGPPEAC